jgi:hypothetical protein
MHEMIEHITLSQAAKIAPGRPSINCLWRWCRRGVIARSGERVRLQHVRVGGKIFTAALWLEEFGRQLAEADQRYFDLAESAAAHMNFSMRQIRTPAEREAQIAQAERELAQPFRRKK